MKRRLSPGTRPTRSDERGGPPPRVLVYCAGIAAAIGTLGSSPAPSAPRAPSTPLEQQVRYDGEYGLYVGLTDSGVEVRWLTAIPAHGLARAVVDGAVVDEAETGEGNAHRVALEVDADVVTIEYGERDAERLQQTTIRLGSPPPAEIDIPAADSVFVFGDVHGEFDRIVTLLSGAGLIDDDLRWTGGAATVALLGDLFDRGNDVTRLLWFLYGLEPQAREAGGRILVILGNHEVMVMSGDLRYVSQKEANIGFLHGLSYADLYHPHESILGRWLASKPGLVRMDELLLAHGGVSPTYSNYGLRAFQDSLETFISEPLFAHWEDAEFLQAYVDEMPLDSVSFFRRYEFFFAPESVLWYRDLVMTDTLGAHLDEVLENYETTVHVVAHTPVQTIQERYGGRLIAVDLLDAAAEMLLLARDREAGWTRWKVPLEGPPVPLEVVP